MKRQALQFNLETQLGPNNEVLLLCDGVYLRGFNARMMDVLVDEAVEVNIPEVDIGGGRLRFNNILEYEIKRCSPLGEDVVGPGKLFVSDRRDGNGKAFFINSGCTNELNLISQFIAGAPEPRVTFSTMTVTDNGELVDQVSINDGEFEIVVTGETTRRLGATESVGYAGGTITAQEQSYSFCY